MLVTNKVRIQRLFQHGKCLDVAIDHGIANEPDFLIGLENIAGVMDNLIAAQPDAIQVNYGQADLLQRVAGRKPALVMRTDVGNAYNAARHREMWAVLHNPDEPILAALQMDAAAVVVNLYLIPDEPGIFRMCVENIGRLRQACDRYAMPLMIEPLVMAPAGQGAAYGSLGDVEKIVPLVRLARELGADIIKADPTENVEDFHRVVEAARCPTLVRGGGKGELAGVLTKSAALMAQGASGMVYGRNVYQHDNPSRVVKALMAIIHQGASGPDALEIYQQG
ncbi:Fructose-bisphosphate aldolase class Ia, DhnA family [Candidatus Pantoea symbiotica]|jgi:DhnA family fructose-bisphosphate aldolase class Ia|uniref:Fructose-bisphosphate aldolase class Ia, DhnA family n=1 Tax=Candidatus Pantoea symbiotica TaxID=1884370 RepID=A0A1I3TX14_9GAMM|nr:MULTISPECIES: aldolase [Pantoea]KAJ9433089.1 aldolase [Pantoea sp. YR343]MRT25400.1 aldolase [Enterobacteriaceae bacterium RIT697]SFJ75305.1 Fructose-bisphosphate aldolase class Ia, DhnA family [Pantoea symbiotica]SFU45959.1 Fructose-bisphosphate aldolase class Ia, DhnA family [Pantoea sp. YR525]